MKSRLQNGIFAIPVLIARSDSPIYLESAAFMFHMVRRIWGIRQVIASRVFLGPEAGFWLAPFSQKPALQTRKRQAITPPAPGNHV